MRLTLPPAPCSVPNTRPGAAQATSRDASLQFNYRMQSREPLAQRFQRYFDRIERSQVGVFNSLSSAPARTRRALQPVPR